MQRVTDPLGLNYFACCAEFRIGAPSSKIPNELDVKTVYRGVAASLREHLIEAFNRTQDFWRCVNFGLVGKRAPLVNGALDSLVFLHSLDPRSLEHHPKRLICDQSIHHHLGKKYRRLGV